MTQFRHESVSASRLFFTQLIETVTIISEIEKTGCITCECPLIPAIVKFDEIELPPQ
jgi:hypothetical protein